MSLSERQEMQAMAIEADREVGLQRREQDEVEFLKAALYIAFVPGASEFFDYLKTGLDSVLVNSRTTMAQASDVAQKSKSSGVSSPLSEGSKPAIPFRKPAESKVNVKTKIDFYAQQKGQQKKSRINFKGEKVAIDRSNDTARRGLNKAKVKNFRERRDFRENLKLKPQTNLAQNPDINNAQAALKQEEQGLTPANLPHKPRRPNGMAA